MPRFYDITYRKQNEKLKLKFLKFRFVNLPILLQFFPRIKKAKIISKNDEPPT